MIMRIFRYKCSVFALLLFKSGRNHCIDMTYGNMEYSKSPIEKEIRTLSIRIKIIISAFHSLVRNSWKFYCNINPVTTVIRNVLL